MAAYAALVCLERTIEKIIHNHMACSSFDEKNKHAVYIHNQVIFLQQFLEDFPDRASSLENQIRDVANEAEDIIDRSEPAQMENVRKKIISIVGEVMEVKKGSATIKQDVMQLTTSPTESSSRVAVSSKIDSIVGADEDLLEIKSRICGESRKLEVIPIVGMGGIGKTTLAKRVYDDPLMEYFHLRVWVTISQDYSKGRIFSSLLSSMNLPKESDVEKMAENVYKHLKGRRYLVVMDDMWSTKVWDDIKFYFPDDKNGSRIMLTTRLRDVASYPNTTCHLHEMRLMDKEQSWRLLREKVFGHQACPLELECIGKEIASSCEGLPLAIVVIAGLLSTVSKNPASWQEIAEYVKSADTKEHEQIEDILSLSYNHLPQYLRPCFLYMASFPEDHRIYASKLVRLWLAEGFVKHPKRFESLEEEAEECLEDLVRRSLVLVTKRRRDGRTKFCSLHDLIRDLCMEKAHESKFLLNLTNHRVEKESFMESIVNQRRLSVDSSSLMHISSIYGSTIHTIMCSHYHIVKLDFLEGVELVRVLDAESADVESLPAQLFKLFHLRYLAIRYSHDVPRALSKLQNLQTLIIRGEKRSKFGVSIALGMSVPWCMAQLRYVCFRGDVYFDDPTETTCSLENLQKISRIALASCTEQILKKIPNLKKVKLDCSRYSHRARGDEVKNLIHLHRLENLKIHGYRPDFMFTLPGTLKKVTLDGLGIPWSHLTIVGSLPNLRVLKLMFRACSGRTWETNEGEFQRLEFLLIHITDLKYWITDSSHFPLLKHLSICYCQYLNEIPEGIGEIPTLELIEIGDDEVNESLVESARRIQEEQRDYGNDALQVQCWTHQGY